MNGPVVRGACPLFHVADVARSAAFYAHLGFRVANRVTAPDGTWQWCWLQAHKASLMVSLANGPVDAGRQAALLYVYTEDVEGLHDLLVERGIPAGEITAPFYDPRGEFRVMDPDGWVVMVAHSP